LARLIGRRDAAAAGALGVVTILVYFPLAIQGRVLSSFDSLVYFYPQAAYLAERLRQGAIPLWDPYLFAGVPFLANSQAGVLYPPTWLDLVGPVSQVYSGLVIGHAWLLSFGVYLLGRQSLRLSPLPATFAAIAVAFGGYSVGMIGHLNQLEAFALAPFAILGVERAVSHQSWRLAFLAAIPFALAALAGHSQVLYMTALLAGAVGVGRLAQRGPSLRGLAIGLVQITVGPALGALIAAAQLVPTLELTRQSIRSAGLSFGDAAAFSLPPTNLLTTLLPTIGQPPKTTEWLGYVGLVTLLLAGYGLFHRHTAEAITLAVLALVGLLLALGQFTPFYQLAFNLLPGVRLFRVPARWLSYWTLGAGLLAGWGLETLLQPPVVWQRETSGLRANWASLRRIRVPALGSFAGPGALFLALLAIALLAYKFRRLIVWPNLATSELWLGALVGVGLLLLLARVKRRTAASGLVLVLVAEVFVGSLDQSVQQAIWPAAVESRRLSVDHLMELGSYDRVLAIGDNTYDPGDLASLRQMLDGTLPPAAVEQSITAIKHVEGLTPNLPLRFDLRTLDGYDGGVLPLIRYRALKQLFPVQGPDIADGRLRIQLKSAPPAALLSWLNVRYLLMDRLRDQWLGGVYYDLALTQTLAPDVPLSLDPGKPTPATGLGIVLSVPKGRPAGTLRIDLAGTALALDPANMPASEVRNDTDPASLWLWRLTLANPATVDSLRLTWQGATPVQLRALSLVDERDGASAAVPVTPTFHYSLLADMKLYDNRGVLSRAFLADGLEIAPSLRAAVDVLRQPDWPAQSSAVAAAADVQPDESFQDSGPPGETILSVDEPERIVVETNAIGRRVLILTDSAYPGWQATVDGAPAPIRTVNLLFRGVIVPAGTHTVAFSYEPTSWRLGLALSALGLLLLGLGLWLGPKLPGALSWEFVRRRENRRLIEEINAVVDNAPETAEDRALRKSLRRRHRKIVEGDWS
jgi:hypothetical protein